MEIARLLLQQQGNDDQDGHRSISFGHNHLDLEGGGRGGVGAMQTDTSVNPSTLRFRVGDLVMFKEKTGWCYGEVVKVCLKVWLPPKTKKFLPYLVWPHINDPSSTEPVEHDTDDFIRPRDENLTPDPTKVQPHLVYPGDPRAFLYSDIIRRPHDNDNADGNDIPAELFNKFELTTTTTTTTTTTFPKDPVYGVPGKLAFYYGKDFYMRRHYKHLDNKFSPDPIGIFKSILPSESTLSELEEASKASHDKMLQLADVLMSGINGWKIDRVRASRCYHAAAFGCQENEVEGNKGVPAGNPEAMVAMACLYTNYIKQDVMTLDIFEPVPLSEIINFASIVPMAMDLFFQVIHWSARSVQQGWVSPFVLELSKYLHEMEFLSIQEFDNKIIELVKELLKVHEYRLNEAKYEKMQEEGQIPRGGDPSDPIIERFRPKANQIFLELPESTETIHIEYREVPRHPFPLAIYVTIPARREVLKIVKLPEWLQIAPFSQESFEYVWLRIAFDIHLGRPGDGKRTRPSIFTVLNSRGNREFASYLRKVLGGSSTQIRLVSYSDEIVMEQKKHPTSTLGNIIRDLEDPLLEVPGLLYDSELAPEDFTPGVQRDFERRYMKSVMDLVGTDRPRDFSTAMEIKGQGNNLFMSKDFHGASRRYSVAIQLLSHFVEHDKNIYGLLGTLLSNRAACFLELESNTPNNSARKLFAQSAIKDCSTALKSSWVVTALPPKIFKKLNVRHDQARARYDTLSNDFLSVVPILFPYAKLNYTHSNHTEELIRMKNDIFNSQNEQKSDNPNHQEETVETASGQFSANVEQAEHTDHSTGVSKKKHKMERGQDEALMEYGKVIHDNRLARNVEDGCPICIREFSGELAMTHSAVLPCGEHALCVECICSMKKEADQARKACCCPLCRVEISSDFVEDLAYQIIEVDQELAMLVFKLPLEEMRDSIDVANRLLWSHGFRVEKVVDALETMLDDQVQYLFFRDDVNLAHQQKDDIYRHARRPVEVLQEKMDRLLEERRTTFERNRLNKLDKDLRKMRSDLTAARQTAREEIYSRINSVGTMGVQQDSSSGNTSCNGLIQIDFHGLHIGEMQAKFDEHVKPILPVVKTVMIITGRGSHSSSGESKLKKALIKRIEHQEKDIRWERIADNPGAINVLWQPAL